MAAPNIVNVTSIYGRTQGASLGTTLTDEILLCPSDKLLKINSIIVSSVDAANSADVTVYFYDGSASTRLAIASAVTVPAKSTLVVIGKDSPIYLAEGDSIEAGASAASDLQIIISFEELDDA
jgi:precorrin-3B methylase